MAIYSVVDGGVVTNTIVADQVFADQIAQSHQAIRSQIGSEHIGDKYANGIFLRDLPSGSLSIGAKLSLKAIANCSLPLSYQWRKNGTDIPGATSASYEIAAVLVMDTGEYSCVVSDGTNSITTNASAISVG